MLTQTQRRKIADYDRFSQLFACPIQARKLIRSPVNERMIRLHEIIEEPSAGEGTQLDAINDFLEEIGRGRIARGYDLDETLSRPDIVERDFLKAPIDSSIRPEQRYILGAPPIGPDSKLAIAFINHALDYYTNYAGFVLPITFSFKEGIHDRIRPPATLYYEKKLPSDFFYLRGESEDTPYITPVVFQIWYRPDRTGVKPLTTKVITRHSDKQTDDFCFLPRNEFSPFEADAIIRRTGAHSGRYIKIENYDGRHENVLSIEIRQNRRRVVRFLKSGILKGRTAPGAPSLSQVDVCNFYRKYLNDLNN